MSRTYSLAYLTANTLTPPQAVQLAAQLGCRCVGLRLLPNAAGAAQQFLVDALHVSRSTTTLDDLRAIPRELLHDAQICDAPTRVQTGRDFSVDEMIHSVRFARLLPGEGGIGLRALFDALPAELPVSVEIPNEVRLAQYGQTVRAQQAIEASRAVLEPRG